MSKKQKRNAAKSPKQACLVRLKVWFARRTSGEWIIAVVLLLGLVVVAKYPVSVLQEKLMYSAAEKEIDRFANQASAIAPSKTEKYTDCSRSSSKFDDGFLGCRVGELITYQNVANDNVNKLTNSLDRLQRELSWNFEFDNTKNLLSSYQNIISVRVYKFEKLTCSAKYEYGSNVVGGSESGIDKTTLVVTVSCGGPALREYY